MDNTVQTTQHKVEADINVSPILLVHEKKTNKKIP